MKKLYNVQEGGGGQSRKRLMMRSQLEYSNNKMNVILAAQTLLRSTAQGMLLCKELKFEGFEFVEATCDYIPHMD